MKLVTHLKDGHEQLAMLIDGILYDTDTINNELPSSMAMFLNYWDDMLPIALSAERQIKEGSLGKRASTIPYDAENLLAPVPFPTSCRDGYAFRQHVAAARLKIFYKDTVPTTKFVSGFFHLISKNIPSLI